MDRTALRNPFFQSRTGNEFTSAELFSEGSETSVFWRLWIDKAPVERVTLLEDDLVADLAD